MAVDKKQLLDEIADKLADRLYDFNKSEAEFAVKNNIQVWKDGIEEFKSTNKITFGALKMGAIMYWDDIEQRLVDMSEIQKYFKTRNPELLKVRGIEKYMRGQIKGFYNALYDYLFEQ